ncbi:MAG: carbohydrate ABC transporter permease [Clostridiales bacterium]|nr:carbohydrate ABC transporter permease [Clostridiales bacterium]
MAKVLKKKKYNEVRGYGALTVVGFIFLLVYSLSLFVPALWSFMTTFKTEEDLYYNVFGLPEVWTFENYITAFSKMYVSVNPTGVKPYKMYLDEMILNSVLYAVGCTLANVFTAAITAYGCARFKSKVGSWLHASVILVMIIPIIGSGPSEMQFVRALGFRNHIWGMVLMKANYLGTDFLIYYAAFKGISKDYSDAASIDGAGNFTIMMNVIFPLIGATIATMSLLAFIGFWNDSNTPLLYLPDRPTLALGLYKFNQRTDNNLVNIPMRLTGCFIMFAPILAIFIAFRKRFMLNVNIGGLKG